MAEVTGKTSIDGRLAHFHNFTYDMNGKGMTLDTMGEGPKHIHRIFEKQLQPSGLENHRHKIAALDEAESPMVNVEVNVNVSK